MHEFTRGTLTRAERRPLTLGSELRQIERIALKGHDGGVPAARLMALGSSHH